MNEIKTSTDSEARMRFLAQTMPSLWEAPGIRPWNPCKLDEWASTGGPSHGERCSAQFLLSVWNPEEDWKSRRFDIMEAMRVWDEAHRQAFLDWAADPWWA